MMLSADEPRAAARLKIELGLECMMLCDTERQVIQRWDVYNPRERGGIAVPSVFVLDIDRHVLAYAVYAMANRVPAGDLVKFLRRRGRPLSPRKLRLTLRSLWHYFRSQRRIAKSREG